MLALLGFVVETLPISKSFSYKSVRDVQFSDFPQEVHNVWILKSILQTERGRGAKSYQLKNHSNFG